MFITIDFKRLIKFAAAIVIFAVIVILLLSFRESKASESFNSIDSRTLVLDAGHGGIDGGAVSKSGIKESDINLSIAKKTEALAQLFAVNTVMTRDNDTDFYGENDYSEHDNILKRAEIADLAQNAVLLSIHQNTYPSELVSGAEVMYAQTSGSEELGLRLQSNLILQADPQNRRVARPAAKDLLLTRSVHCPAVLIECGFLSNPEEASKLSDNGYQLKLAAVIAASYIQYVRETSSI